MNIPIKHSPKYKTLKISKSPILMSLISLRRGGKRGKTCKTSYDK